MKPPKTSYSGELNCAFFTIHTSFEFHQSVLKYLLVIKSIYFDGNMFMKILKVLIKKQNQSLKHLKSIKLKDEGKVKGVYGMKFFYLADDENPFLHNLV